MEFSSNQKKKKKMIEKRTETRPNLNRIEFPNVCTVGHFKETVLGFTIKFQHLEEKCLPIDKE